MRNKNLLAAVLALGIWGLVSIAAAQQDDTSSDPNAPRRPRTLMDSLGDFGRSIFGPDKPAKRE